MEENKKQKQYEADRRWIEKNPDKKRYLRARSNARTFARKYAESREEVEELLKIFDEENEHSK